MEQKNVRIMLLVFTFAGAATCDLLATRAYITRWARPTHTGNTISHM